MKDVMSISEFYKRFPTEAACEGLIAKEHRNDEPVCALTMVSAKRIL